MKAFKWIVASAVLCISSTLVAGESNGVTVSHYEPLQRLSFHTDRTETTQKLRGEGPTTLSFDALGQSFELQLEPYSGFLSAASSNTLPGDIEIFRGQLAGNPDSWTRIVVYDGTPRGLVWDGVQMYAIEAPGDSIVQSDSPVIYRLADTFIEPGTMSCGSESLSGNGAAVFGKLIGDLGTTMAQGPGAVSEIEVGAVGDFEFTSAQGGDAAAAAAITARLNNVDGIYSQEIGVQINVPLIETFSDPADPFTDELEAGLLLDELTTYRQSTPAQDSLGLTHLWTGRDLNGSTVGIAWNGVLCRSGVGSGLSEGNGSAAFDSLIAAHEIGHNFGAPHDGVPPSPGTPSCESEPQTFIMAPMLNGSTQFSPCSITIMQASAAAATACVTALPTVDMTVSLSQSATALLGTSPELTTDLSNNGDSSAINVAVDITLPTNVSFVSATASSGSCANGAGTVNCQLGDIPGISGRTVTVTTAAAAVGAGTFDATVTADFDERPGNNQDSVQLTVDPAVELVINTPTAAPVLVDQSTAISAVLENRSILDATGVTLTISLNSGLRADSASWSIGSCTVAAQQIDCQTAIFSSQSNSTLNIGVTGLTAGAQGYTVTLSSNEAEADPANNSVNGTVTVNSPAADSGGGAIGVPFLWLLGLAAFLTRRRSMGI
jgi:uncharacterized repeat protein (TIGR01451 family)